MSISSESSRVDYTGNGTQSVFPYSFKIFNEDDLTITVRNTTSGVETTLVKPTDYTVDGVGETSGGNVTLVDASQAWLDGDGDLDTGYVMTIRRAPDLVQETDIRNQGSYYPEGIENQFDKQTFIDQKQQDEINRSMKLPETIPDSSFDPTLPTDIGTADSAIVTNATGDGLALGPSTSAISGAQAAATDADEHKQTAERWANLTSGTVVDVDTGVDSLEYSSKEYAIGVQNRGASGGGSAKDWAQYTGGTVDDVEFSAKKYASDAAASAAAAATSSASSLWNDVEYKTFADSPISILDGDAGTLFIIDCSGGNVVVNLPEISTLTLSGPWSVGFKKSDTSSNTITINEDAADEIDEAAGPLVITRAQAGTTLIPDTDPTPDSWSSLTYGEVPIAGAIVGDSDTQTLTNKTFDDELTLQEIATPSTPASGYKKIYPKSDDKLYTLNDAGEEVEVGSGGGGSGGINYVQNPNFEVNIDNVTTTANITESAETTNPLRGSQSLALTISSSATTADTADIGLDDFDPQDLGKKVYISFDYATDSNYSSDDVEFVLRNTDSSVDITLIEDNNGSLQATGGETTRSRFVGTAEVDATDNSYSLRMNVLSAPASNSKVIIDNIKVGPDALVPGAIVTDWQTFTPSFVGFGTGSTASSYGYFRRMGDSMQLLVGFTKDGSAGSGGSNVGFALPNSHSIDTNKLGYVGNTAVVGSGTVANTANDATAISISGLPNNVYWPSTGANISAGEDWSLIATVPIDGWSAGTLLSTTEAVFSAAKVTSSTLTTATHTSSGSYEDTAWTEDRDNLNTFDGTTFTAPKSGFYYLHGLLAFSSNATGQRGIRFLLTNADDSTLNGELQSPGAAGTVAYIASGVVYINKGGTAKLQGFQSSGGNLNYDDGQMSIAELPDFSTFSVHGNAEYLETVGTTNTSTATADTWTDATGMTITLTPGVWDIGYDVLLALLHASGSNTARGTVGIFDSSDVLVGNTVGLIRHTLDSSSDDIETMVGHRTRITVTETETYKIRIRAAAASSAYTLRFAGNQNVTGSLTDPDAHSVLWARRVS